MKLKILLGSCLWVMLITSLHVQLNVGWTRLASMLAGRQELIVGFLPVT
ncbi:MAG: hypothetical protein QF903_05050 [Planctomycetota bacterium]|nr:hypothetical protein [Planctomycetota bacterium]